MQIRPNISMAICTAGASRIAPVRQENPPSTIVGLRPRCFDVKLPMKAPTMPARNSTLTKSWMRGSLYLQNAFVSAWWLRTYFQRCKTRTTQVTLDTVASSSRCRTLFGVLCCRKAHEVAEAPNTSADMPQQVRPWVPCRQRH
eukprot:GHUV01034237.1.p1 GENE.GHUV01034237.1~~GHUV01034237.1.p1  ORF type:complete len:143 (+),score=8.11 GHUV01034237.1:219-647(+)